LLQWVQFIQGMKSNRIISLRVIGGFLDGLTLDFDTGLTCIIGARGTGKSTILELIRFCLDPRRIYPLPHASGWTV
jgi:ABC-type lipoprotein export system ATPase subunit